jgi:chemotaxis protein methyltransferase CheR
MTSPSFAVSPTPTPTPMTPGPVVARPVVPAQTQAAFDSLRRLIYAASAIVLERNKDYLFESRLSPLLVEEGLSSFQTLVDKANRPGGAALRQRVIEAMTTNETFFFRDIHPFDLMRKTILPEIADTAKDRKTLSIWSAASSSGQELYSIAMLLREQERAFSGWTLRLLGSDLSTEVLAKAAAGRYSQLEVNRGLPAPLLVRHFTKIGVDWQIKDDLRRMVSFRPINLIEPWPALPVMDVIFLRNVLIYFDVDAKRRVLDKLASVLRPGGYLFLGGVETTLNLSSRFSEHRLDKCTCYRLAS